MFRLLSLPVKRAGAIAPTNVTCAWPLSVVPDCYRAAQE